MHPRLAAMTENAEGDLNSNLLHAPYHTGDPQLDTAIGQWLRWDKNPKTREQIENLLRNGMNKELRDRLCCRMTFGTAGLRSAMGAGFCYINDLTVIQSTQGMYKYLERCFSDFKQRGFVVGYDTRGQVTSSCSSQRLAKLTAAVLLAKDVPVYLFSRYVPTPFVPYAVQELNAVAGVMITASHNRKEDNGYKVYWENGAQITSPHDKEILKCIEECVEPWNGSWNDNLVDTSPLKRDPLQDICRRYMDDLKKICFYRELNSKTTLKFVHTSFHGVGHDYVQLAFQVFGFKPPIPVPEQKDPDPDFSTVKCPNPEEGESVLELSLRLAEKENARIVLATDPDADRLAVAELQENGVWKVFTGNELAALFGWWMFDCWKKSKSRNADVKNIYMLATTVSSKILKAIALKEGFHFEETLPGFKWIGSRIKDLLENGKEVLFSFEESIGFLCGTSVLDKDGVSAAVVVAEMASYLETMNITLKQQLINVYEKYGYHISKTSYFLCYDPTTIKSIFERLRNFDSPKEYPKFCGTFAILHVRDITTGYDSSQPNKKSVLPVSKSSQMITFTFQNGCVATLRTSGTEPKIKYYAEMCASPDQRFYHKVLSLHEDSATPVSNPLLAFTLIKRLQSDWKNVVHSLEASENIRALKDGYERVEQDLPAFEDLEGAARALMRLQDVYMLNVKGLARGVFQRVTGSAVTDLYSPRRLFSLTGDDCFQVGKVAYDMGDYYHAIPWLEEAVSLFRGSYGEWKTEDEASLEDALDHLAFAYFQAGNVLCALNLSREFLLYSPDNKRVARNVLKYEKLLAESPNQAVAETVMQRPNVPHLQTRDTYEGLCQTLGSQPTHYQIPSLYCSYETSSSPYLLLQPVRKEVIHLEPYVVLYHDFVSDAEAQKIRGLAEPWEVEGPPSGPESGLLPNTR